MYLLENCDEPVAIVGAGASGLLSAIAVLGAGRSVVLVERDRDWRTGPAYATTDQVHLLNVAAGRLSATTVHPLDFVDWAAQRFAGVTPDAFLPRRMYGTYLRERLERAARNAPGHVRRVTGEAVALERGRAGDGWLVMLDDGRWIVASHVVLALGNPPCAPIPGSHGLVVDDPWMFCAWAQPEPHDAVVLVGSGLTAVDVALSLRARGHEGPIRMLSRRGMLPRAHELPCTRRAVVDAQDAPATAAGLVRWFRTQVAAARGDWRVVIDAVRPHSNEIWAALPSDERARLVRHVSRYWEVHRHRVAPQVHHVIEELLADGRLTVHRGTVTGVEPTGGRTRVVIREAGRERALRADWVVNCTGPNFDLRAHAAPIVRSLFARGLGRSGPLGSGFDVTGEGALVGCDGEVTPDVSVVGPLRRGVEWETTAIPEIREQAEALARHVRALGVRFEAVFD
jgi:uncharacterized NAD(P)/FAD-binding protein YdhS